MLEQKLFDDFETLVQKELTKITTKGDITPIELDNVKDAVCVLEKLKRYMNDEPVDMYEEGSSRAGRYGNNYPNMRVYYDGSYTRRSPSTGRYMNGRYGASRRRPYDGGNSYHGGDTEEMIERLEMMKDEAMTEEERVTIDECIRKLMK